MRATFKSAYALYRFYMAAVYLTSNASATPSADAYNRVAQQYGENVAGMCDRTRQERFY